LIERVSNNIQEIME